MPTLRIAAFAFALMAAPVLLHAQREKLPPDDLDFVEKKWPDAKKSNTGIRYVVEVQGNGPLLVPGDKVMVTYVGSLLNGKVFDSVLSTQHPFTFRVGRSEVIAGWDQIGYGRLGSPPKIPSEATLVFEIEVLGVRKDS